MGKKYISIDFLRGIAIFMMIFFHILTNLYDMSWVDTRINDAPIIAILLLMCGVFFGAWAGLFLMISSMGNTISMYKGFEKGQTVKQMIKKQVLGGFILLIFAFLAEGIFQYYGVFVSYHMGTPDPYRAIWHAYTMETIHTIAISMILNAIIQGILSINGGHLKIKRNMIILAILAVISFIITQPIWDWAKTIVIGYPDIQRPTLESSFSDYIIKLILLPLAGSPEPIVPFFGVSCIGSILGLALCRNKPTKNFPVKGILAGITLFILGIIIGILLDVGFDGFLPLDSFSRFVGIGGGINYNWVPWILFITAGQIITICTMLRLVEFRGKSEKFAQKTAFIRRFGTVPFSLYCWHRIIALIPLELINLFWRQDSYVYCECYSGYESLALIAIILVVHHLFLILWEKINYTGSLEWMMATIGIYVTGKHKSNALKDIKWYKRGELNAQTILYDVEWIDICDEEKLERSDIEESKLALKNALLGLIFFPSAFLALVIAISSEKSEGKNNKNKIAKIVAILGILLFVSIVIALSFLSLNVFGLKL